MADQETLHGLLDHLVAIAADNLSESRLPAVELDVEEELGVCSPGSHERPLPVA